MTQANDYWRTRAGADYETQHRIRREAGNPTYDRQEQWMLAYIAGLAEQLGRPVRVMDYGLGYGRMARVLAGHPRVEYFGFDVSSTMVAPLLASPPLEAPHIASSVFVAPSLDDVPPLPDMDLIFTVSVLIHNTPVQVDAILESMIRRLAPEGRICLVENAPVCVGFKANSWHAGCWVHDFAFAHHGGLSVYIDDAGIPGHGIYIMRRPRGEREVSLLRGDGAIAAITHAEWMLHALAHTRALADALDPEATVLADEIARARDSVELVTALAARFGGTQELVSRIDEWREAWRSCEHLREELGRARQAEAEARANHAGTLAELAEARASIAEMRATNSVLQGRVADIEAERRTLQHRVSRQQQVRQALFGVRRETQTSRDAAADEAVAARGSRLAFLLDAPRDREYAQQIDGFRHVCHVAHQEWFGIRAAAGALPGHKLAVSVGMRPTEKDVEAVAAHLDAAGVSQLVIHGFSDVMATWVRALRAAGVDRVALVWHGAPAMWLHDDERRIFGLARELVDEGLIARAHVMRPGNHDVFGERGWRPQVYNMPPRVDMTRLGAGLRRGLGMSVLVPSWHLLHKNLVTNVLAAALHPKVDRVKLLAKEFELPVNEHAKLERLGHLDARSMLEQMALSDIVSNVSLVDCHPMVELEALAVGTVALRGRLALDALEDHVYVRLTQVADPLSVASIQERLSAVLSTPPDERAGMLSDYRERVTALAAERYHALLGSY